MPVIGCEDKYKHNFIRCKYCPDKYNSIGCVTFRTQYDYVTVTEER